MAEDEERIEELKEMESLARMREAEKERAWMLAMRVEEERREKERRLWEEREKERERWVAEDVALKLEMRREREEMIATELESLQLEMGCQNSSAQNVAFRNDSANSTRQGSDTGEERVVNSSTSFLFSSVGDSPNSGSRHKGGSLFLMPEPCAESLSMHTYGFTWGQQDSPHLSQRKCHVSLLTCMACFGPSLGSTSGCIFVFLCYFLALHNVMSISTSCFVWSLCVCIVLVFTTVWYNCEGA